MMRKRMYGRMVVIVIATVFLAACGNRSAKQAERLRCVETVRPDVLPDEVVTTYSGKVKETRLVNVAFKTAGPIDRIHVRVGDHVKQGQLLAEIEDSDYLLGVQNYEAQYRQLQNEVERIRVLYERKSVSLNDYEKAETGLKQLEVALKASRNRVQYCKLYAPSDGVIVAVNYNPSELVDAGMAVFSLLEDAERQVILDVPASVYNDRRALEHCYCRASFAPDERVPMRLATITPKADNNQLFRAYLDFQGKADERFTPGMSVQVELCRKADAAEQGSVAVPLRAVCQREDVPFVWVVNSDSTLRKQPVDVGMIDAQGRAHLRAGLDGSETIVRAGAATLQEGEKVKVID